MKLMGLRTVTFWNRSKYPAWHWSTRSRYKDMRQSIRKLRSHSPTHRDVDYYADGLGLGPEDTRVTVRHFAYNGHFICCIGITGPVGTLP